MINPHFFVTSRPLCVLAPSSSSLQHAAWSEAERCPAWKRQHSALMTTEGIPVPLLYCYVVARGGELFDGIFDEVFFEIFAETL